MPVRLNGRGLRLEQHAIHRGQPLRHRSPSLSHSFGQILNRKQLCQIDGSISIQIPGIDMHETDGDERQPCAQYHFALHGEIFEMHVFDLRRRLDLDQTPATRLSLRSQDTLQNIRANQHPTVQKRGFENRRHREVLDQFSRLRKSGFCLTIPRCHQYPAWESDSGPTPRLLFPYRTSPESPHPAWSREKDDGLRDTDACDIEARTGILTLTGAGPSEAELVRDREFSHGETTLNGQTHICPAE